MNMFLEELSQDTKNSLVKLKENEAFASRVSRDITSVYNIQTEYKRKSDNASTIIFNPHRYTRCTNGLLNVSDQGVILDLYISSNSPIIDTLIKLPKKIEASYGTVYALEQHFHALTPDSGTRHFQGYDAVRNTQVKEKVDLFLNKQLNKLGIKLTRDVDVSCGDYFKLTMDLTNSTERSSYIKLWIQVLKAANVTIKLNSVE